MFLFPPPHLTFNPKQPHIPDPCPLSSLKSPPTLPQLSKHPRLSPKACIWSPIGQFPDKTSIPSNFINSNQMTTTNEVTIADIANNAELRDKKLSWGVIIDISEPFEYEEKNEHMVKIKIIDPTFNFKEYIENRDIKFHKFVTIQVAAKFLNKCPKIKSVGDIIRLRRFNFVLNDNGELLGYQNVYSNWLVYHGQTGAKTRHTCAHDISKNKGRKLSSAEEGRLFELREWSNNFFQQHSLKNITWTSDLREPTKAESAKKASYECQNVDLILKASKVLKDKKAIHFVDHRANKYTLFLQAQPALAKNDVIKLRCVNVLFNKDGRLINLTENSSCLVIPDHFLDSTIFKNNGKITPMSKVTPNRSGKNTPLNTKRQANAAYPFLAEYDFENDLLTKKGKKAKKGGNKNLTIIKSSYANKVPTSVKQLLTILNKPKKYEHQRFVVSGYVLGFSQNTANAIVKKMDIETKKVYTLTQKVPKARQQYIKYIYHFILFLKDASVEGTSKNLNVYVLTNEVEQNLFDLWNTVPTSNDVAAWNGLTKTATKAFEKKLKGLQDLESKVKIVVELLITSTGRPFYKLYDTVFLP